MTKKINAVLLIYNHPINPSASTINEHIESFARYSKEKIYSINTEFNFPSELNKIVFKTIIFHYSLFAPKKYLLSQGFLKYLEKDKDSYRIAFFQDEYQYCNMRFEFINQNNIKCIYSLLEPTEFDKVYFKYTNVENVFSTLTGYVSPELISNAKLFFIPFEKRTIDVSYRARYLEYFMGEGAQEKMEIGRRFLECTPVHGLKCDIKVHNTERFNGWEWHKFLANSKAVLGVEAGVSIFDLEDKVRISCRALLDNNPEIDFHTVSKLVLKNFEGNVYYRQISPRIFEAAALGVVQILFEGRYSGIIEPYIHYIPLKKDFSNIDEVISLLKDKKFVSKVTDAAYKHLIMSGNFEYKKFINEVDQKLSLVSTTNFLNHNLDYYFKKIDKKQKRFKNIRILFAGKNFFGKSILKKIFLPNH